MISNSKLYLPGFLALTLYDLALYNYKLDSFSSSSSILLSFTIVMFSFIPIFLILLYDEDLFIFLELKVEPIYVSYTLYKN